MLTSVEGFYNLRSLEASQTLLKPTTLLVGSARIKEAVDEAGHRGEVLVADDPSDEQMVNRLLSWVASSY